MLYRARLERCTPYRVAFRFRYIRPELRQLSPRTDALSMSRNVCQPIHLFFEAFEYGHV